MKRTNSILCAAFLLLLFGMSWYTLRDWDSIRTTVLDAWKNRENPQESSLQAKLEFAADQTEGALNAALDRDHYFIELYGGVQRLTGQRFIEDNYSYSVIRMDNGSLTFGSVGQAQVDVSHNAASTAGFASALGEKGIPLTAVITPCKNPQDVQTVPAALRNYYNEQADQFLSLLEADSIHTVDLRDGMGDDLTDYFYRTDHHWNADGAFWGNRLMTAALAEEYGFTPFEHGLNEGQFARLTYQDLFLGSQGKRVGTQYAGVDDFVVYSPRFPTDLTYQVSDAAVPRTGTLNTALYFQEYLEKNYFNGNPYLTFAGGDWGKATAVNHLNPDGPSVVMIRDSFGCAITPFFALQCSQLITIDLRAFGERDLMAEIEGIDPDFVLMLYNPSTLVSDNMFAFMK